MSDVLTQIGDLPKPLSERWLATSRGHIVLNHQQHGFVSGDSLFRQRILVDVAWLKLAFIADAVRFLTPVGRLVVNIVGWGQAPEVEPALKGWEQFVGGVQGCFRAGYGISLEAQQDVGVYVAEGIAHFLVDRRSLNRHDPRLEKLLAATLFDPAAYR